MSILIRQAQPSDAPQLITLVQKISAEPDSNLMLSPGEFNLTVPEEEEILSRYAISDNSIFLVAVAGEQVVGLLNCNGGKRRAARHTTILGISIDSTWRDQGVGSQLMAYAVDWAKGTGVVSRIELAVFERNERAIHLYQKFDFEIEGRRRQVACRDGKYLDDLIMALIW